MTEKTVRECDYHSKALDCRKREGVQRYVVTVGVETADSDCELIKDYQKDLCPRHYAMLVRNVEKVLSQPDDADE